MAPWNKTKIALAVAMVAGAAGIAISAAHLQACGPFLPTSVLDSNDADLLRAPIADFENEIQRLFPQAKSPFPANAPAEGGDAYGQAQTDDADAQDLKAATGNEALASQLQTWRKNLRAGVSADPPAGLPAEFTLYEQGAVLYHKGDLAGARSPWEKLLALPEKQRQYRTVWAAYMFGRSLVESDPVLAASKLAQVRALAQAGFPDKLGLAAASFGWEARADWVQKRYTEALALYFQQSATGEPFAIWSLRDCARELLAGDDPTLRELAADPLASRIITAYILAKGGPFRDQKTAPSLAHTAHWLEIMEAIGKDAPGAERLAWAAYMTGDMNAAARWLALAGKDGRISPIAQWVQAKLDLRAGNIPSAMRFLASAAKGFPQTEEWSGRIVNPGDPVYKPGEHAAGELATLKLSRGDYTDSLDLLVRNNFWMDAAYVAERVLSADELKEYVDKNWPPFNVKPVKRDVFDDEPLFVSPDPDLLRELLARRLTRLGRWKEARPYFLPPHQAMLDDYIAAIRQGGDPKRSAADRAESLWQAAQIARADGMDLLATEGDPDWHSLDGEFDPGGFSMGRGASEKDATLAPVSKNEEDRAASAAADPDKRFHYRYIACDHAWDAAQLMPDESDQTARMLIEAGSWLKDRDPAAADRFYKALIKRCGNTELGKQAAKLHWFPPLSKTTQEP